MARKRAEPGRYSVRGPEVSKSTPYLGAAISYAQGVACRSKSPLTLYVRDIDGTAMARIERVQDGTVYTHGYHSLRA